MVLPFKTNCFFKYFQLSPALHATAINVGIWKLEHISLGRVGENGTEISMNQAFGLIQSKHSVSFSAAPDTWNVIQLHVVLSRTHEDLQMPAGACRPGGNEALKVHPLGTN